MRPSPIAIPKHVHIPRPGQYFARASGRHFEARTVGSVTHLALYDEIGSGGVSANDFRTALQSAAGSDVVLRLNSPGGDVFDGLAMFADLVAHPGKVRVEISGVAASAASLLAMAADEISMACRSFLMIHNSHALSVGDARTHDEVASLLRQIDASMRDTYAARAGQD